METPVLTVPEAAALLKCSRAYIYKAASAGSLPSCRLGTDLRFVRDDLLAWLRSQTSPPRPVPLPSTPRRRREPPPRGTREAVQTVQEASGPAGEPGAPFYAQELVQDSPLPKVGKGPRLSVQERRERQVWVVTAVRRGATLAAAATVAGLSRRCLSLWQSQYPEFDRAVTEAARAVKASRSA